MTDSTELLKDLFPVSSLQIRYQITASVVNARRNFLKIPSVRSGKTFYISNEDLTRLDKLHQFVLAGGKMKDYVEDATSTPEPEPVLNDSKEEAKNPEAEVAEEESTAKDKTGKKKDKDNSDDEEEIPSILFQAIGTIRGNVTVTEPALFKISFAGAEYRVYIPTAHMRYNFRQQLKKNNNLYLRVYPRTFITPDRQFELYFQLVAWSEEPQLDAEGQRQEPGMFKLKGVWQFVPQFRAPILTIYRNRKCQYDPSKKFKANHLPILMRREDSSPFRFNPKVDKESAPPRYFINAMFKFLPQKNSFGWQYDIEPPTTDIPRYRKPVKVIAGAGAATTGTKTVRSDREVKRLDVGQPPKPPEAELPSVNLPKPEKPTKKK